MSHVCGKRIDTKGQYLPDLQGADKIIPETFLPDFLDLVFWGHEHD